MLRFRSHRSIALSRRNWTALAVRKPLLCIHAVHTVHYLRTLPKKNVRARPSVGAWQLEPGEGSPGFDRTPSMGVDDEWWFAEGSLEEIPYRKDGDGDVDSRL